jgi:hypothetical protein
MAFAWLRRAVAAKQTASSSTSGGDHQTHPFRILCLLRSSQRDFNVSAGPLPRFLDEQADDGKAAAFRGDVDGP